MSNKTYTAAEVEELLKAEREKSKKASTATVSFEKATKLVRGTDKPYTGVTVNGPFRPHYLPMSVANAILANTEAFVASVKGAAVDKTGEGKALSTSLAPRLAVAKS